MLFAFRFWTTILLMAVMLGTVAFDGCQALGQWGTGCAPVGALADRPCSPLCVCGCNAGQPCRCVPIAPVTSTTEPASTPKNFGLAVDRLNGRERHLLGQREVSKLRLFHVLGIGAGVQTTVPDTSKLLRLVVIDADSTRRAQVRKDLDTHPALTELRAGCQVQDYGPDHWHVQDLQTRQPAFAAGTPRICLMTVAGEVLHSQPDYDGGAEALAEAYRRARPDYDPARDPDRRPRPDPVPQPVPAPVQSWSNTVLLIVGIVAAFYFLFARRQFPCNSQPTRTA